MITTHLPCLYRELKWSIDDLTPFSSFRIKLIGTTTNQAHPPYVKNSSFSMTLIPVKGNSGLFRDSETGVIINNNTNEYNTYMTNRNKLLSEKERLTRVETKVQDLSDDIGDIKRMLQQLTNGQ